MDWFDKAEQELEDDLESGEITNEQFRVMMRDLRAEYIESQSNNGFDDFL